MSNEVWKVGDRVRYSLEPERRGKVDYAEGCAGHRVTVVKVKWDTGIGLIASVTEWVPTYLLEKLTVLDQIVEALDGDGQVLPKSAVHTEIP